MAYFEHIFERGADGRCDHPVSLRNPDFDHFYVSPGVVVQNNVSSVPDACATCGAPWAATVHETRLLTRCRADRNSVLHDPEHPEDGQRTHWCAALEAGGDCMCYE